MARVLVSYAIAVALLAWVAPARAQILSDSEAAGNASVDVRLMAVDDMAGVRLELYDPNEKPPRQLPAVVCFDRCALHAVPGRYLLRVSGPPGSDVRASRRFVDIEESSDVYVDPPSSFQRTLGLTLGIVGPALIVGGIYLGLASNLTGEREQPWWTTGAATVGVGIVMTPVGWVMYGVNGKPEVTMRAKAGRSEGEGEGRARR